MTKIKLETLPEKVVKEMKEVYEEQIKLQIAQLELHRLILKLATKRGKNV